MCTFARSMRIKGSQLTVSIISILYSMNGYLFVYYDSSRIKGSQQTCVSFYSHLFKFLYTWSFFLAFDTFWVTNCCCMLYVFVCIVCIKCFIFALVKKNYKWYYILVAQKRADFGSQPTTCWLWFNVDPCWFMVQRRPLADYGST